MSSSSSISAAEPPEASPAALRRQLDRERRARNEAERALETISSQLYDANAALESSRQELEQRVLDRTSALQAALEQVELVGRARDQFLGTMGHELRTPLNGVLGQAQLLATTPLDADQQRLVQGVTGSASELLGLLNAILEHVELQSGAVQPRPAPTDPAAPARSALLRAAAAAGAAGVTLEEDSMAAGAPVRIDAALVERLVGHLVANAVKFTPAGGRATVSVDRHERADGLADVTWTVSDTGVGIPAARLGEIFEPFVQIDGTSTRRFGGAGLGLAIARGLADRLGGRIEVESASGAGSTFRLVVEGLESASAGDASSDAAKERAMSSSPVVLVVEDDQVNRLVAERMLAALGCRAEFAVTGEDALALLDAGAERFSLVLMDCNLPGIDGFEVTRRIRAGAPTMASLPVVALTAGVMPDDVERCTQSGMDGLVAKPVRIDSLRATIEQHVTSRRAAG